MQLAPCLWSGQEAGSGKMQQGREDGRECTPWVCSSNTVPKDAEMKDGKDSS